MTQRKSISFPKEAWCGLMEQFKDLLVGRTECPEPFAWAAFLSVISTIAGKNFYINYGRKTRLNTFILLVGEANDSHKGLAIDMVEKLINVIEDESKKPDSISYNPDFHRPLIKTIDSGEGLVEKIPDSGYGVVLLPEFVSAIKKSRGETSTIESTLINAYDCEEIGRATVKSKRRIKDPYICFLGATNPGIVNSSLKYCDVDSGLLGRFMIFYGKREKLIPLPKPINEESWKSAINSLSWFLMGIKKFYSKYGEYEIKLSDEAEIFWEEIYKQIQENLENMDDPLEMELLKRLHLNLIKTAGLISLSRNCGILDITNKVTIDKDDLYITALIGNYAAQSAEHLRESIGKNQSRKVEDKIYNCLRKNGPLSKRELQQKVRGKDIDSRVFNQALKEMSDAQVISFDGDVISLYPDSTDQQFNKPESELVK